VDLATLGVEIAFAICFAWSFATWARQRDPVSREVTLVFTALGSTILLTDRKSVV